MRETTRLPRPPLSCWAQGPLRCHLPDQDTRRVVEPGDWFWEGHVQRRVEEHLRAEGWSVVSAADTLSRQTGIDLVLTREDQHLNIEVKGWPSTRYRRGPKAGLPKPTNPTVQARHWYAGALLTTALLLDADPHARVALAFPDFPRYRDLLHRTAGSLAALKWRRCLSPRTAASPGPTLRACSRQQDVGPFRGRTQAVGEPPP